MLRSLNGRKKISRNAVKLYNKNNVYQEFNQEVNHSSQELINALKEQVKSLESQLSVKDTQILQLTETIKAQAQSINADRHNELAQNGRILLDGVVGKENIKNKRNLFSRLFKGE